MQGKKCCEGSLKSCTRNQHDGYSPPVTYACTAWEFAADTYLSKLQRLQNRVLRTIGNFPRSTPVHNLHLAFEIPYVYDFITKLSIHYAVIQNRYYPNVPNIGQGEAQHGKYKKLKAGGGQPYDQSNV
jgi:hypothetical protein